MINNIFPCLILNFVVLFLFALPFIPQINACMTIFMTFSIYSLRVSSDMPTQSQYLPMVTLYFLLGISYTFIAYIWFIIANEFQTKSNTPQFLMRFAAHVKRVLYWIFDEEPLWKRAEKVVPYATQVKMSESVIFINYAILHI